jgi:hypothetical protein
MATTPRQEVKLKLDRAREHADALRDGVLAYFGRKPVVTWDEEDTASGDLITRARATEQPPDRLSLVAGDALHNARTALDHLAWQLVLAGHGKPGTATCFPVGRNLADYQSLAPKALKGASSKAIARIDAVRPWKGGDDDLWLLHRLDIDDKHKLLVQLAASNRGMAFTVSVGETSLTAPFVNAGPHVPLADGDEVGRVMAAARPMPTTAGPMAVSHAPTFTVIFGPTTAAAGEPASETVSRLVEHAASVALPLLDLLP